MSDHQRIVITGLGLTCPLGNDLNTFREGLLEGKSGDEKSPIGSIIDTIFKRFQDNDAVIASLLGAIVLPILVLVVDVIIYSLFSSFNYAV